MPWRAERKVSFSHGSHMFSRSPVSHYQDGFGHREKWQHGLSPWLPTFHPEFRNLCYPGATTSSQPRCWSPHKDPEGELWAVLMKPFVAQEPCSNCHAYMWTYSGMNVDSNTLLMSIMPLYVTYYTFLFVIYLYILHVRKKILKALLIWLNDHWYYAIYNCCKGIYGIKHSLLLTPAKCILHLPLVA